MSNAEQAWKVEAERKRWGKLPTTTYNPVHEAFHLGYTRGRADAMELPEVRAEELVMGEWYLGKNILINKWDVFQHDQNTAFTIQYAVEQFSFRGPLPLGGGE